MSPMNILIFRFNFAMIVHPLTTSGVHIEGQILWYSAVVGMGG